MLRQLREDARDYPATMTLCGLWVVVFLLMVANQWASPSRLGFGEFFLGLRGGHRFGDMTIRELLQGEVWRALTATFVHFGLLHLGMNLYAMYHLGCLVESWYGSGFLLGIYVLTGGGGNLLSSAVRYRLGWDPSIASGGGSVVVMGLVGLCAVVGGRAGTRLGDYLRNQMILVLALTGGVGAAFTLFRLPIIDNWGHACGAFVGALIGPANRWMSDRPKGVAARLAGTSGAALIAACLVAQVADDRAEAAGRAEAARQALQQWADSERHLRRLEEVKTLYRVVALPRVIVRGAFSPLAARGLPEGNGKTPASPGSATPEADPDRELYDAVIGASFKAFGSLRTALDTGPTAGDFRRALELLQGALRDPPALEEFREFESRVVTLQQRVRLELETARAKTLADPPGR